MSDYYYIIVDGVRIETEYVPMSERPGWKDIDKNGHTK